MATRHLHSSDVGEYYPFHIGAFTAAGPANPATQAAGAANAAASTFPAGSYTITYAWVNSNGQSLAAPTSATITLTLNQSILTTAVSPPAGCTVNWYIVSGPGGVNPGLAGNNSGAAFMISANPSATAAQPYTVSTTAARASLPNTQQAAAAYYTDALDYGHGVYLSSLILNTVGTGCILTLFNGNSGNPNSIIAQMAPTTNVTLHFDCVCTQGLYWTYSGTTAGSVTLSVLPVTN